MTKYPFIRLVYVDFFLYNLKKATKKFNLKSIFLLFKIFFFKKCNNCITVLDPRKRNAITQAKILKAKGLKLLSE